MKERAESIGTRVEMWSSSGGGTEIQVNLPASVAFSESDKPRKEFWARRR